QLLPLVYDELRKLAAQKLAQEKPGQTLQATALVHEAYLRLVGGEQDPHWHSRRHFFAAAADFGAGIMSTCSQPACRTSAGTSPCLEEFLSIPATHLSGQIECITVGPGWTGSSFAARLEAAV